jgi:Domain of unknown function (DUF6250)
LKHTFTAFDGFENSHAFGDEAALKQLGRRLEAACAEALFMGPVLFVMLCLTLLCAGCVTGGPGDRAVHSDVLDDLSQWHVEAERGGTVVAKDGVLTIDVPAGVSVWFRQKLSGPVQIDFDALAVRAGGPNDRVSDLNCFWMASDARNEADFFAVKRNGQFADYNQLKCYYVGLGGNANTTTRFRRYIGSASTRPLLPEHDLRAPEHLLVPNVTQHIRLIADGPRIAYQRDGITLFEFIDAEPYTSGYFAFRTVTSHLRISHFRVSRPSGRR